MRASKRRLVKTPWPRRTDQRALASSRTSVAEFARAMTARIALDPASSAATVNGEEAQRHWVTPEKKEKGRGSLARITPARPVWLSGASLDQARMRAATRQQSFSPQATRQAYHWLKNFRLIFCYSEQNAKAAGTATKAHFFWSFSTSLRDAELMQKRKPVGLGPSGKTDPRWASQRRHITSVRAIP